MRNILLAACCMAIIIAVAYFLFPHQPVTPISQTGNSMVGWKTCNYPQFGFRFQYPPDWKVYAYSVHQGMGNIPIEINCGDLGGDQVNYEITVAISPNWEAATGTGGMQLVRGRPGDWHTYFSSSTPSTTRDAILGTLEFMNSTATAPSSN